MIGERKYSGHQVVISFQIEVHQRYQEELQTYKIVTFPSEPHIVSIKASAPNVNIEHDVHNVAPDSVVQAVKDALTKAIEFQ